VRILSTRVLPESTFIGRKRALIVKGESRFAQFANLTGRELLGKTRSSSQVYQATRVEPKIDELVENLGEDPDLPDCLLGIPNNLQGSISAREVIDFTKYSRVLEQKRAGIFILLLSALFGTLASIELLREGHELRLFSLFSFYTVICLGGISGFLNSSRIQADRYLSPLVERYKEQGVPRILKVIDAKAANRLELEIRKTSII
jgi:hypothetical protein